MRYDIAVVREVAVISRLDVDVRCLELHEHQRDAVDEQHHVGPTQVQVAADPELRHRQPVICFRVVPVNETDPNRFRPSVRKLHIYREPVTQQVVDFTVRTDRVHRSAAPGQLIYRPLQPVDRHLGIQTGQSSTQPVGQNRIGVRLSTQRPVRTKSLVETVNGLPAEGSQLMQGRSANRIMLTAPGLHLSPPPQDSDRDPRCPGRRTPDEATTNCGPQPTPCLD